MNDKLLEHMKNPETHQLITATMKLNPTQYMLELAKGGAKLPSTFDVSTIIEEPLGNLPLTTFTPTFNTPFPPLFSNMDQSLTLPSTSHIYNPPLTTNNTSLLQALQNHPLVNTQNLEENMVLGISLDPKNTFTPSSPTNPPWDPLSNPHHMTQMYPKIKEIKHH
jgi:hypothetical protein